MRRRGFMLIEVMMTLIILGILAAIAVPGYTRFTARAYRTEMLETVAKLRAHFLGLYAEQGAFGADIADVEVNPLSAAASPAAAPWDPRLKGWIEVPISLDGPVRMRYWYAISGGGRQLTLQATGRFPGIGAYVYSEALEGTRVGRSL